MRISVAMATYNGEKYIREQLNSLKLQSLLPHELIVGDDGSLDQTLEIVKTFTEDAPFPVRVFRNHTNLGYSENFLQTAARCTGEWTAFCDQDDVWLPNKLQDCADAIRKNQHLVLVLQNADLCDDKLVRSGRSFPNSIPSGNYAVGEQYGFWVWPGFLQTIRTDLIQSIRYEVRPLDYYARTGVQSRDKWTCMIANALGEISVIGEISALYRRHADALTGLYPTQTVLDRMSKARLTGQNYYRYLSQVALSSERVLDTLADEAVSKTWKNRFRAASAQFSRLSLIQLERSELYRTNGIGRRLTRYLALWRNGGYVGPKFTSMGLRSAAKDAVVVITGSTVGD